MYFAWFRRTFLRVLKLLQIKKGGPNFWEEPILQNVWIIWFPLLFFNFKSFLDPNSLSFIKFQSIMHELGRLFSECWNFYKLRRGGPNFWGKPIWRMSELLGPPFCFSIFKNFLDPNSSPFITFQCILYDSGVLLSGFSNFYKLKRGDLISVGNQFCRMSELFGPPFCISILKVF